MRTIVVTGASTGIGRACCELLARRGFHVMGSVRKQQDGEPLLDLLGDSFTPLLMDVTREETIRQATGRVEARLAGEGLFGLVNNAGIAVAGPLEHMPLEDFRRQFDVNLFGLLAVTKALLPALQRDSEAGRPGRIINMSSINGVFAAPFLGPYAASKHAVEALTDSLRRELLIKRVDVIAIGPGVIDTPIWDKAEQFDWSDYDATAYGDYLGRIRAHAKKQTARAIPPARVAATVHKALTARRPRARYPIVNSVYYEGAQLRFMPKRLIDWLIRKQFGV